MTSGHFEIRGSILEATDFEIYFQKTLINPYFKYERAQRVPRIIEIRYDHTFQTNMLEISYLSTGSVQRIRISSIIYLWDQDPCPSNRSIVLIYFLGILRIRIRSPDPDPSTGSHQIHF